jgi:hypothetical protein
MRATAFAGQTSCSLDEDLVWKLKNGDCYLRIRTILLSLCVMWRRHCISKASETATAFACLSMPVRLNTGPLLEAVFRVIRAVQAVFATHIIS